MLAHECSCILCVELVLCLSLFPHLATLGLQQSSPGSAHKWSLEVVILCFWSLEDLGSTVHGQITAC